MDTRPDSRAAEPATEPTTEPTVDIGVDRTRRPDRHGHPTTRSEDSTPPCEHGWSVESRHTTSIGLVLYVRCLRCGVRRVDVQEHVQVVPHALSAEIDPR